MQGFKFRNLVFYRRWAKEPKFWKFQNFSYEIIWNFDWFWMNLNKTWPNSQKNGKNRKFRARCEHFGGGGGEISNRNFKPWPYVSTPPWNSEVCAAAEAGTTGGANGGDDHLIKPPWAMHICSLSFVVNMITCELSPSCLGRRSFGVASKIVITSVHCHSQHGTIWVCVHFSLQLSKHRHFTFVFNWNLLEPWKVNDTNNPWFQSAPAYFYLFQLGWAAVLKSNISLLIQIESHKCSKIWECSCFEY